MNVDVYADIACPWCRLGTHRLQRAIAEAGATGTVTVAHRPFQLDPQAGEQGRSLIEVMTEVFGDRAQVDGMVREMTELGAAEGIEFRFDRAVHVNTFTAHRLLAWTLAEHGPQAQGVLASRLFDLYFRDGGNVADHAHLARAAEAAGIDPAPVRDVLASDRGADEVRQGLSAARRRNLTSAPTIVFDNGETLVGAVSSEQMRAVLERAAA